MKIAKTAVTAMALIFAAGLTQGGALAQSAVRSPAVKPGAASPATAKSAVSPPAVPVEPWTAVANPDRPAVQITKTAKEGGTRFVGGCSKLAGPGFGGKFLRYAGNGLKTVDGQSERVIIEVRGAEWKEAFAAQLRYSARDSSWELASVLAPVFVASFSRGATLAVRNSQWQEVFSFDLTGSTNAARLMREACGF